MQWKIIMSIQNKQESIISQTELKNKAEESSAHILYIKCTCYFLSKLLCLKWFKHIQDGQCSLIPKQMTHLSYYFSLFSS